jgi:hypothetical protein
MEEEKKLPEEILAQDVPVDDLGSVEITEDVEVSEDETGLEAPESFAATPVEE